MASRIATRLVVLAVTLFVAAPVAAAAPGPTAGLRGTPETFVPETRADSSDVWGELGRLERDADWAASDSVSSMLIARLEATPPADSIALSRALLYFANSRIRRRLYADGRGFGALERAIAIRERHLPATDPLTIWAHVRAATFYPEAGAPDRALAHGEAAVSALRARAPLDSTQLCQVDLALGTAYVAVGNWTEARDHFGEAIRLGDAIYGPANLQLVPMIAEYGAFLARLGEFDEARDLLRRAVRISERSDTTRTDFLENSLARLSTLENKIGNVAESLEIAGRAYELAQRHYGEQAVPTIRLRTVLAYRLDEIGDRAGSAALLREIVPAMAAALGPDHPQTLNARLSLINSLVVLGDTTEAARELTVARASLARQPALANSNAAFAGQVAADLERARGRFGAARDTLEVAIRAEWARHDPIGEDQAVLFTHLYDCLRGRGDRATLDSVNDGVTRLRDSTHVRASPYWAALVAARAAAESRAGLRDAAWNDALEAERLGRMRLRYQLHALSDRHALQLARELGFPCDLLVATMRPRSASDVATAWDRVIRWRGLVRHEIERRRLPAAALGDTALTAAHLRWVKAQRHLAQLVVSGAAHPDDPESAGRFETARRAADLAEQRYLLAASGRVPPDTPVTLDRVLRRLGPDSALVAFAVGADGSGEETLGAFVARGGDPRPRWVPLGSAGALGAAIRAWVARLSVPPTDAARADGDEAACRALGRTVRERIWDPVARAVGGARRIFLVPEGPVTELPWLALPEPDGRYLAETRAMLHTLDAERDLVERSRGPSGRGLLALGAPDFDRVDDRTGDDRADDEPIETTRSARRWPCAGDKPIALPPLPGARAEVEAIARSWPRRDGPAEVLIGARADERAFKRDAPGRAVLHLATHGVVVEDTCLVASPAGTRGVGGVAPVTAERRADRRTSAAKAIAAPERPPESPWLGQQVWLALAGANRPPGAVSDENEGLLTAEEVVTLDLRGTDWVVLSACHSGLAPAWAREGVLGMERAFRLAGARTVIASRWAVGDESTREWMAALYAARSRGDAAGPAVESACRSVLAARRATGRSTHPFYWAAFSSNGE